MHNSKFLYLIDYGHGGLIDGKYQTSGKRSPKFPDKTFPDGKPFVLYEGVNNRKNGKMLIDKLNELKIDCMDIVNSEEDIPLKERVKIANELNRNRKCIYISIHSNAFGNGRTFNNVKGNSVHIYNKSSGNARKFADILSKGFRTDFDYLTRWRGIKENSFYVLRFTHMPAVLLETGFFTNKAEAELMLTCEWRELFVKTLSEAIIKMES